jgi:hypothetical protein
MAQTTVIFWTQNQPMQNSQQREKNVSMSSIAVLMDPAFKE